MRDLTNPSHMLLKAAMFAVIGFVSAGLLVVDHPSLRTLTLVILTIWAFARLYYFAFYVIERYIDPTFKFSGLFAALHYLVTRKERSGVLTRPNDLSVGERRDERNAADDVANERGKEKSS